MMNDELIPDSSFIIHHSSFSFTPGWTKHEGYDKLIDNINDSFLT